MWHQLDAAWCRLLHVSYFVERAVRHRLGFLSFRFPPVLFSVCFRCRFMVLVAVADYTLRPIRRRVLFWAQRVVAQAGLDKLRRLHSLLSYLHLCLRFRNQRLQLNSELFLLGKLFSVCSAATPQTAGEFKVKENLSLITENTQSLRKLFTCPELQTLLYFNCLIFFFFGDRPIESCV